MPCVLHVLCSELLFIGWGGLWGAGGGGTPVFPTISELSKLAVGSGGSGMAVVRDVPLQLRRSLPAQWTAPRHLPVSFF